MHLIDPITEDGVKDHIGKPVCVVLKDGTHLYGELVGLNGTQLSVKSAEAGEGTLSTNSVKAKAALEKTAKKAAQGKTSAVAGFPPFAGGVLALELALIALLFVIPFFFI